MKKISVVIPMYYEEEVADICYKRVVNNLKKLSDKYSYEIIFINDGSKDSTLEILKKIASNDDNVKIISFSRNFGHQAAVTAGIRNVTGDAIIIMDADLQDPPELFEGMIEKWEEGYEVVYGKRKTREGESIFKLLTARMFYNTLNKLSEIEIPKDTGDFRLLDRRCVNALKVMKESQRNSKSMFSWIGYKKKAIFYDRDPRVAGKTKWNYSKLINLAIDVILFVYFIYVIAKSFIVHQPIQAFQATILLILFFSGIQIMLFGIVGEYLGRIFNETKNRPLYLVNEYNGEKENNEKLLSKDK